MAPLFLVNSLPIAIGITGVANHPRKDKVLWLAKNI